MFIEDSDEKATVVVEIEDNGQVAHAYLKEPGGKIKASVWLYNNHRGKHAASDLKSIKRGDTPANMPEYGGDKFYEPIDDPTEVEFFYKHNSDGALRSVLIYLRGMPHAVLTSDEGIGWSVLASKDGPLAHVLERSKREDGYWDMTML